MAPLTTQSMSQQTEQQPLRRATYVHVSDLISAYNIDHVQLEREIARVNAKRSKVRTSSADATSEKDRTETDEEFTGDQIVDGNREANAEAKIGANTDNNSDGVAVPDEDTDLETSISPTVPQKRLQPPRGGFNLCVLVGRINLVVDKRRVDQSRVRLAEVEIGDETGTVSLRARDEQIDLLERVRSKGKPRAVVLRNCTLELYQGRHIRLAVTKWGKLTEYPDNVASTPGPPPTMNMDRNFSFIDLSLVASEIAEKSQSDAMTYASSTSLTTNTRQTKKSEAKASRSASSSPKSTPNKPGQSNTKQQQQQTSRRNRLSSNEQRRQARNSQYGGTKGENKQPPRSNPMMFSGIQGYHGYGDQSTGMRMRQQYPPHGPHPPPYAHSYMHSSRPQDAVSAQFALHQQYEMQQRQLHQLYSREQNRQVGQVQHQPQQPSSPMLLRHMGSFDASTGSYMGDISVPSEVGNSPILIPPPDHYNQSPKTESHPALAQEGSHNTASYAPMGSMSPYRLGKMNPEASSFAPSYLSAAQGTSTHQQITAMPCPPQYASYTLSQQQQQPLPGASVYPPIQSGHHPSFYLPAAISPGVYHHSLPQPSFNPHLEQGHDANIGSTATANATSSARHQHQYPPATASTKETASTRGKENVTSKP